MRVECGMASGHWGVEDGGCGQEGKKASNVKASVVDGSEVAGVVKMEGCQPDTSPFNLRHFIRPPLMSLHAHGPCLSQLFRFHFHFL